MSKCLILCDHFATCSANIFSQPLSRALGNWVGIFSSRWAEWAFSHPIFGENKEPLFDYFLKYVVLAHPNSWIFHRPWELSVCVKLQTYFISHIFYEIWPDYSKSLKNFHRGVDFLSWNFEFDLNFLPFVRKTYTYQDKKDETKLLAAFKRLFLSMGQSLFA